MHVSSLPGSLVARSFVLAVASLALCAPLASAQTLAVGSTVTGTLAKSDPVLSDGSHHDDYTLKLPAITPVEIRMESSAFDTYLGVFETDGTTIGMDDDGGGGTNSMVLVPAGAARTLLVRANSAGAGVSGQYTISVRSGQVGGAAPTGGTSIAIGGSVSGALATSDPQLDDKSHYDDYVLQVPAGVAVQARMESGAFDTFLGVVDASGTLVASDDDSGGGTNSLVSIEAGVARTLTLRANSVRAGQTGPYTLSVTGGANPGSQGGSAQGGGSTGDANGTILTDGSVIQGSLATGDDTLPDGGFVDLFFIDRKVGEVWSIVATSADIDTFLLANIPGLEPVSNDDAMPPNTDSLLVLPAATSNDRIGLILAAAGQVRTGDYVLAALVDKGTSGGNAGSGNAAPRSEARVPFGPSSSSLASGQPARGELTDSDDKWEDGTPKDTYVINRLPGQEWTVTMESSAFDTFLIAVFADGQRLSNDDGAGGTNSRLVLPAATTADQVQIHANCISASNRGAYVLTATSSGGSASANPQQGGTPATGAGGSETPAPRVLGVRVPEPRSLGPVVPGRAVTGRLEQGDAVQSDGALVDWYRLELPAGTTVGIDLRSQAFDTYLIAWNEGVQYANDDWQESTQHSRLEITIPPSGFLMVGAGAFGTDGNGKYSITVERADLPSATRWIAPGAVVKASLREGDGKLTSGEFADTYILAGQPGDQVTVTLTSQQFDTYLILKPGTANQVDNDDFDGSSNRSQITATMDEHGMFVIRATSYAVGESGDYEIRVDRIRGVATGGTVVAGGGTSAAAASPERRTFNGRLAAGGPTLQSGEFTQTYTFTAASGQRARIEMVPQGFDSYLILKSPSGEQVENDDFDGDSSRSVIVHDLTETGEYSIIATSYAKGESGSFTVTLEIGTGAANERRQESDGRTVTRDDAVTLVLGTEARGRLESADARLQGGEYRDLYVFAAEAGANYEVTMESSEFDPYLLINGPGDYTDQNDDFEGSSTVSKLIVRGAANGRYRIQATSYRADMTGNYRITVRPLQAGSNSGSQPVVAAGRGRMWGIFVGIADYPGQGNDLANTDLDATYARDSLVQTGHIPANQAIVILNQQATRASVREAFDRVRSQMRAGDDFIFFYSGHGSRTESRSATAADPDGFEETLSLCDGNLLDDDVAALFDRLPSGGRSIIVLDSCFSGGFSKEVVSKPGRLGLFSSPEFMVSAVPDKFRAGGYLARFFADGVKGVAVPGGEGETADDNNDGVISAHEICYYVSEGYRSLVRRTKQSSGIVDLSQNLGYQTLVYDMSVDPNSPVFPLRR